tara:strand:- start:337 stop:1497 length:1161 start_codon:yes stop_codon:yes gene_type:complete
MKKIPYGRQQIDNLDLKSVVDTLKSDFLTTGPKILEFEEAFANYVGSEYAVSVSNGTGALHLCALALGVDKGSKVITTPISFAASSNCVLYCGGKVKFVDINPDTLTLDLSLLEKILEDSPKNEYDGIIPVNFSGFPVDTEKLRHIANKYNLWIIEDACHSPGGSFKDSKGIIQHAGNCKYSDLAIFSFHPVKHITSGEGGMITTNDKNLYEKLLMLRSHGIVKNGSTRLQSHGGWAYDMLDLGFNYRLTDFQASLGLSQLKKADKWLKKRNAIANKYDKAFKNTNIKCLKRFEGIYNAFHLYIIQVENREKVYNALKEDNIYTQIHYIPIYKFSYYRKNGYKNISLPNAEKYYDHCISLPMYPSLKNDEIDYVIEKVLRACSQKN